MTYNPKNVRIIRAKDDLLTDILYVLEVCELDNRELVPENFFIASLDENVIGCIRHKFHEEDTVEFCSLGVLPDHRGKGIGKALLKKKLSELINKNVRQIYVVTVDDRIFVPFGFKHDSNPKKAIQNKIQWCQKYLPVDKEYFAMKYEYISGKESFEGIK